MSAPDAAGAYDTGVRFTDVLLDEDGLPPCAAPEACETCRLFSTRRPDEDRAAWLARMIGSALGLPLEVAR